VLKHEPDYNVAPTDSVVAVVERKDRHLVIGLLLAGAIGAWVPESFASGPRHIRASFIGIVTKVQLGGWLRIRRRQPDGWHSLPACFGLFPAFRNLAVHHSAGRHLRARL
jgi:hypothetical protein